MHGDGFLEVAGARFSKYALQVEVQGRRSERIPERLGNKEDMCVVPVCSRACGFITDFRYAKKGSISTNETCWQVLVCQM